MVWDVWISFRHSESFASCCKTRSRMLVEVTWGTGKGHGQAQEDWNGFSSALGIASLGILLLLPHEPSAVCSPHQSPIQAVSLWSDKIHAPSSFCRSEGLCAHASRVGKSNSLCGAWQLHFLCQVKPEAWTNAFVVTEWKGCTIFSSFWHNEKKLLTKSILPFEWSYLFD